MRCRVLAVVASSSPTGGRSSSMRSASCPPRSRSRCYEYFIHRDSKRAGKHIQTSVASNVRRRLTPRRHPRHAPASIPSAKSRSACLCERCATSCPTIITIASGHSIISTIAIRARPAYQPRRGCGSSVAVLERRTDVRRTDVRRCCAVLIRPFRRPVVRSTLAALTVLLCGPRRNVLASELIERSLQAATRPAAAQRRIRPGTSHRVLL
jgi:hypothetical protein